jgi:TPR repeat protein
MRSSRDLVLALPRAALFCEAEEARAELNNVWAQSIACRAQLQEAKELTNEVQKVIDEHPEAAAGLRHKLELSAGDLGHLRQEIDDIQQQIAKELCRCSRYGADLVHQLKRQCPNKYASVSCLLCVPWFVCSCVRVSEIAEEDPSRVEMLSRARALGSREARYLLGKYYMRCTDPGLKAPTHLHRCIPVAIALSSVARVAQAKAYSYLTRIAEPNAEQDEWATKAMYQLGLCHLYGIHTQADPSLAFCYFCNAADRYVAFARLCA